MEGGFLLNAAPLASAVETSFAVQADERDLLVGILAVAVPGSDKVVELEVLFGGAEGSGAFTQVLLVEGEEPRFAEFLPGPESRDSAYRRLRPSRVEWKESHGGHPEMHRSVFVFLRFPRKLVFRHGERVGFNVVRHERSIEEFSSWNLLAGNGSPDAQSLGWLLAPEAEPPPGPRFSAAPSKTFSLQVTNDSIMSILAQPYSPGRFVDEMRFLKQRNVSRLYWVDYAGELALLPTWRKEWKATLDACGGEPLPHLAHAAEKEGVELVVDYKLYDFCFNLGAGLEKGPDRLKLPENLYAPCGPGLVGREHWFARANATWKQERHYPIRTLRFYSREPLPPLSEGDVELLVSADNRTYRPYRGVFRVGVERVRRPHAVWSPAGVLPSTGKEPCDRLVLSGLELKEPFAALRVASPGARLVNLRFRLAEAEDAQGAVRPFFVTTKKAEQGKPAYTFQPAWSGWANHLEPLTAETAVPMADLGLCFEEAECLPGFLEVAHPEVHDFWLKGLEFLFRKGAKAVCLRTLAHHYTADSWLNYAFHPVVTGLFRQRFGRDPKPEEADYARIRKLRGEAFTGFLRKASALARKKKRRLLFQIETGAELPEEVGTRLQFAYELETWIGEKLVDEFVVRGASPWWPWLREWLLPRAQKAGLPVHWVTRNLEQGPRIILSRQPEILAAGAAAARRHGFSGISLYESMALYTANPAFRTIPQPGAEELFARVSEGGGIAPPPKPRPGRTLRELGGGGR